MVKNKIENVENNEIYKFLLKIVKMVKMVTIKLNIFHICDNLRSSFMEIVLSLKWWKPFCQL